MALLPNHKIECGEAEPIELKFEKTATYVECRTYDAKLMSLGFVWHQVIVKHNGKVSFNDGKKLILDAIFDVVGNEEFFPVCYRQFDKEDYFLVRLCNKAMDKLFATKLRIRLANGSQISLVVQLNVAEYKFGQIAPKKQISFAIRRLCKNLQSMQGENGLLDLSNFNANPEFDYMELWLSNRVILDYLCDTIYKNDDDFRHINGLILSSNGIKSVAPLQIFHRSVFTLLDLRFNNLDSIENLCRDLKKVNAKKLLLAGNPLTETINYPLGLKPLSKNFRFIDETPIENLSKDYTPVVQVGNNKESGFRIDKRNKVDVHKFDRSNDWHGVMVPDPNHEFTKNEIFDYFFITISDEFEPLYPCYYQYISGEHQFLLRNCFKHIVYLVESCNMEIKIPRLNISAPDDVHVMYEKTINYYFRMNISPFKNGEIEPIDCIEKALGRRYNAMDRLLDLDNFQNTPGLENVIINLSSQTVLQNVMSMAGKKFLSSCVEIRLSNNKILRANISKALTLMSNVKAVDLGNNWIHELQDISSLQSAKLKALRLDGNPLCSRYAFAPDYIKAVKEVFPDIHKLDNLEINTTGSVSSQKNYLCDVKAHDFVEQFIPHYFNTFQEEDRGNLKNLYHQNAIFTLMCKYQPAKSTEQNINRRAKYKRFCRNLLSLRDVSIATENVHCGQQEIMNALMSLPHMNFDLLSFTIDVPIFLDNMVVIFVTGILSDQPTSMVESEIVLGFSRTFVLAPTEHNLGVLKCSTNYQILHDLFSVHNPSETQLKNCFKYSKNDEALDKEDITTADKEDLLVMFQEITGLKSIWCTRCLGDANWDFEKAIDVFAELCAKKEIPETAFI